MAIFPLPPGLTAKLNIPPPYEPTPIIADTAPPVYTAPSNRISTLRPESIPLPPSPAPAPARTAPAISISTSSQHSTSPPEYSPSVYSQQRFSHTLPNPADLGFPSSPRRPSVKKVEEHASHFKESRTDLSMREDLEAGRGGTKKSDFRIYPPVTEQEVGRSYWKRAAVGMGIALVVVVVVVVAVGVSLKGKRS